MSWLLKIVEGPMAGAEAALTTGTRVRIGSTDDCDIIIADASIPVFTLDVAEHDVTLVAASGETRVLKPFEIEALGTTAFALGPAEGAWQPLTRPAPAEPKAEEPEAAKTEEAAPAAEETKSDVPADGDEPAAADAAKSREGDGKKKSRRGCGCGCLCALILLLLLGGLVWWFWPQIREGQPGLAATVESFCSKLFGGSAGGGTDASAPAEPPPADAPAASPALADIAGQHGLELLEKDGAPLLRGNVRLRTERCAIRALALKENPRTAFDLTDDETMRNASSELLFVVTEGALKADAASNRVVVLSGYAPNPAELERAIRALNADVPGIARLDTAKVQVGGTPPPAAAKTKFAAPAAKPAPATTPAVAARRDFPIAGIVTRPYPMVVMRNGLRLAEGAQVGTAFIEKIEADRLVLREGKTTFEWRP